MLHRPENEVETGGETNRDYDGLKEDWDEHQRLIVPFQPETRALADRRVPTWTANGLPDHSRGLVVPCCGPPRSPSQAREVGVGLLLLRALPGQLAPGQANTSTALPARGVLLELHDLYHAEPNKTRNAH